jgi:hypothetical protein
VTKVGDKYKLTPPTSGTLSVTFTFETEQQPDLLKLIPEDDNQDKFDGSSFTVQFGNSIEQLKNYPPSADNTEQVRQILSGFCI